MKEQSPFTMDLKPEHMEEARSMYPGGKLRRVVRLFDRVFRPGLVEMTDEVNALVVADRERRESLADEQAAEVAIQQGRLPLPRQLGQRTMREAVLGDAYGQHDRGKLVPQGHIADFEMQVAAERLPKQTITETPNPFQPNLEGILPPGGVIGDTYANKKQHQ